MRPLTRLLSSQLFKSRLSLSLLSVLFLTLSTPQAQADDLNFFKNYFVTGGSVTNGVGLAAAPGGQGTINMTGANGVPCRGGGNPPFTFPVACTTANAVPADVVAAYMYWQVLEDPTKTPAYGKTGSAAFGYLDGVSIRGALLGADATSKCWSNAANQVLRVYRADIRRFLPIQQFGNTDPNKSIGVRVVNGSHKVRFGYDKTGTILPGVLVPEGASMVVVYRVFVPGLPWVAPLVAVTIHDGVHTISKSTPNFTVNVEGFYQADDEGPAIMANVVGNGNAQTTAAVKVNGNNLGSHVFTGAAGPNWDNPTLTIPVKDNDSSYLLQVQSTGNNTCLTWGAVVSTIPVVDSDKDGLLDVWETKGFHENTTVSPATFGGCSDYPNDPCVNFPAMGAKNGVRDLFIQFDWMHQNRPGPQGSGGTDGYGTHDHMPKASALQAVCQTYASNFISAHFDVGNNYQGQPCIINKNYAQGGHDDDEANFICPTPGHPLPPGHSCTYTENYSVLSWKGGFDSVVDGHGAGLPPHFAHSRRHSFHEVLLAHALAGPFCPSNGQNPFGGLCPPNTKLKIDPASVSGIADRPGGDVMITFGLWGNANGPDDKVGNSLQQAGTILHEVGHNLGLFHGGVTRENCMSNYFSSMSYFFQTNGLRDASGNSHIGYSYGLSFPLSESALSSTFPISLFLQYKPRYYAPLGPNNTPNQAAGSHCDGSPITDGAQMIQLENLTVGTPDWSNGTVKAPYSNYTSDINFNGVHGETFFDAGDWFILNLQQVSARLMLGGLSTDDGLSDGGLSDGGLSDGGLSDGGLSDGGLSDGGLSDGGLSDGGLSDGGLSDGGLSDGGLSDGGIGFNDLDAVTQVKSGGGDPPVTLKPVQDLNDIAVSLCTLSSGPCLPPPSVIPPGATVQFKVYRCNATSGPCDPTGNYLFTFSAASPHNGGSCTFSSAAPCFADNVSDTSPYHSGATCPATSTCYDTTYTYKTITEFVFIDGSNPIDSVYSNPASGEVIHLFVIANTPVVAGYTAGHLTYGVLPIPAAAFTTYGDLVNGGTVAGVTCAYYPSGTPGTLPLSGSVTPRNVATYAILCTGPLTGSGGANVGVSYNVTYLTNVPGTLIIDQRAITVTAASAKVYDGNTNCPVGMSPGFCSQGPVLTWAGSGLALAYSDTPNFTESFDNRNVGTTHTVTPAGTANDGGTPVGSNYKYTYVSIATGAITPATLTITASTNTKTFDGTVTAAAIPTTSVVCDGVTVTGGTLCGGDTVTNLTETYDTKNAGSGKTLSVATYTVNDGNTGSNYTVVLKTDTTGQINQAPVTATAGSYTGVYDGSMHPLSACMVSGTSPATFTGTVTCTNNPAGPVGPNVNVGGPTTVNPVPAVGGSDLLGNYAITSTTGSWSITQAPVTATGGSYSGTYDGGTHALSACAVTGAFTGTLGCSNNPAGPVGPGASPTPTAVTPVPAVGGASDSVSNYAITSVPGSWSIALASSTTTVTCPAGTYTYNGAPQVPPCSITVTGAGGLSLTPTPIYGSNTSAGQATASYTFAGDSNHMGSNNSANFTILQAPVTATAGSYSGIYNGSPQSPGTCMVTGTYTGGLTCTNSPALVGPDVGSGGVTPLLINANFSITPANGAWSIGQAASSVNVTCPASVTYTGSPLTPCSATVTGANLSLTPTPSYSNNTGPGTAMASYTYPGDLDHTGNSGSSNFTISPASIDFTTLKLVGYPGSPTIVSTATASQLSMTSAAGQTAAAWLPAPQPVGNSFTSQFQFQILPNNNSPIADGFAFVIQNSTAGTGALGTTGAGGYLGYQGLTNSVAIEFDTYQDCWDPIPNHIAIQSNGAGTNNAYHSTCPSDLTAVPSTTAVYSLPVGSSLSDGALHSVTITYVGSTSTLSVVLDGNPVLSATGFSMSSLGLTGGNAVVGFTAATGSYQELTYISNWSFTSN